MEKWGYLSALLATVLFGLSAAFSKIMVKYVHPIVLGALVYIIAGAFLFSIKFSPIGEPLLKLLNKSMYTEDYISRRDYIILIITALSGSSIAPFLYYTGLKFVSAVNAALLLNVEVLFIVIMSTFILNEIFKIKDVVGMLLILTGAGYIATQGSFQNFGGNLVGNFLIISSAFFWGTDTVLSKFLSKKRDLIWISAVKSTIGGLSLLCVAILLGLNFKIPVNMIPFLTYVSIFSTGLAFILVYFAIRTIGSAKVGSIFPLSSFFGALFASFILSEEFGPIKAFCGLIMLLGVFLLYHENSKSLF
ncbi:protein of unknown function DUF6 transmembrane [Methanothermus fervidus DSM 2088]|uniref:EamA domain-containing protein n=1 Tax=Methanothermus fervidus (strain ATCC 43054 / DSM 2088 / JCM 10308 / V24 S) TaxID=523846 RepID=E3GXI6_METFV|nr:DMT family transporter [Methanothermus fervidus]ADP77018.1 protein of unknown function DUF6 transmembrane [Methanothermus fervidus DSM 2088]